MNTEINFDFSRINRIGIEEAAFSQGQSAEQIAAITEAAAQQDTPCS
jgi:NCAIR mutase (PurE)-related protein